MPKRRNRKNRNQPISNGHEVKKSKKKNQNGNVKTNENPPQSSPRPINLTNNYLNFDNKRNSGSELDEFHTPNNEYPEFSNDVLEKSLNKSYDDEWDDLASFRKPNLEGIPELDHVYNFSSINCCKKNFHAPDACLIIDDAKIVNNDLAQNMNFNGDILLKIEYQHKDESDTKMYYESMNNEKENDEVEEFFECHDSNMTNLSSDQNHEKPSVICNGNHGNEYDYYNKPISEEKPNCVILEISANFDDMEENYFENSNKINEIDEEIFNLNCVDNDLYEMENTSPVDVLNDSVYQDAHCSGNENEDPCHMDEVNDHENTESLCTYESECQNEYFEKAENLSNSNDSVNNEDMMLKTNTNSSEEISVRTVLTELVNNKFFDHINDNDDDNVYRKTDPDEIEFIYTEKTVMGDDNNRCNGHVDDIFCTDEKLEEEVLPVSEIKIEVNHKTVIKRSMTLFVKATEESHSITNVTSISDENLNLSYNDDEPVTSKRGKKSYNFVKNIFSKFKKRKAVSKDKKENKKTISNQTSLPENNEYLDDSSIPYNNSGREMEVDSNKALKSYDDSINNFEDVKQTGKGSCNKSDQDFEMNSFNDNLKRKLGGQNENVETNSISDDVFHQDITEQVSIVYSQENIITNLELMPMESLANDNVGKVDVDDFYRDIESLNKSFLFLNDADNVSVKENLEKIEIKDVNQSEMVKEDVVETSKPFVEDSEQQEVFAKTYTHPSKTVKSDKSKIAKHRKKFFTLFSRKSTKPLPYDDVHKSSHIENDSNLDQEKNKDLKNNDIKVDENDLEKFDEVLNSLRSHSLEDKVTCKNTNDIPIKLNEEYTTSNCAAIINDDHLFPDAITPSKIVNITINGSYDFAFIDDPLIVEQDSLTLFKGETKKILVPTECSAPFASLETLCFSEKSESGGLFEKSTPVHNIKRSFNYLKNFLSVNR